MEEDLPLALGVGIFDSVTADERQLIQKCPTFVQAQPEKDDTDLELALLTIFEQNSQAQVTIFGGLWVVELTICWLMSFCLAIPKLAPYMRQIAIEDGQNVIIYCPEGTSQLEPRSDYMTI